MKKIIITTCAATVKTTLAIILVLIMSVLISNCTKKSPSQPAATDTPNATLTTIAQSFTPTSTPTVTATCTATSTPIQPIAVWGSFGSLDGYFNNPRSIAVDTNNV